MELIKMEDLNVGDEILISCQSYFKYLRVLKKPTLGKKTNYRTGALIYKLVKCSACREIKTSSYVFKGVTKSYNYKTWKFGPEDHNFDHYVNLNERQIILVYKN